MTNPSKKQGGAPHNAWRAPSVFENMAREFGGIAALEAETQKEANLWKLLQKHSDRMQELRAEVALLRRQLEERKPKGGRPRLDDQRVAQIEADLAAGYSARATASRAGVSAMTVSRIAARMKARKAMAEKA